MRKDTASWLNELNARFYSTVHQSFSETRSNAWPGWEKLLSLPVFDRGGVLCRSDLRVLDVACGNLRFGKFLNNRVGKRIELFAVDNCPQLVPEGVDVRFTELDVVSELLESDTQLPKSINRAFGDRDPFDVVTAFGFMHHIPGFEYRLRFLVSLSDMVVDGGHVVVSLWRFLDSDKLSAKAASSYDSARMHFGELLGESNVRQLFEDLEPNDWFLGWGDSVAVYRYCHHFDDREVERIVEALGDRLKLVDDFLADGKTGVLNRYLVFRK